MSKQIYSMGGIDYKLLPAVTALAWPTMLEQLMQTAVQYIDTAMVGSLGTEATAAVGCTTTVQWLLGSTISALGIGFLSYISQARGSGRNNAARKASAQSVMAVLICGILFTVLTLTCAGAVPVWMQVDSVIQDMASQYFRILYSSMLARTAIIIFGTVLRSVGDAKTPMLIGCGVNLINLVLNFLLIYPTRYIALFGRRILVHGADLGVEGAALASSAAIWVGGILITIALFRHKHISPAGYSINPDKSVLKQCLKVALPNALQRFGTSLGYVAFASMINAMGDKSIAAHTIANTVESAFYIPGYGMQAAAATLAGNKFGAGDREGIKELRKVITIVEAILMVLSGGLLFIFAEPMVRIFTADAAVIAMSVVVLRLVALSEPFYGVSIVTEGMLMGMGKTMGPFVLNLVGMWGIRILGTWLCMNSGRGDLVSAWSCMIVHNLFLFLSFEVIYRKIMANKIRFL